jgi:hypothetical protein
MSSQEICIAVNRFHRFPSRPWGPNIPLRKLFLRRIFYRNVAFERMRSSAIAL